jgi:hypothetical protein
VRAVTPAEAERRLALLASALDRSGPAFAEAVLVRAVRRAAGHPTPQSRMVATAAYAKGGTVRVAARQRVYGHGGSAPAGKIAAGSEFGAKDFGQFQAPHTTRGYWLHPAARDADTDHSLIHKVDGQLQDMLDGVEGVGVSLRALEQILGRVVQF